MKTHSILAKPVTRLVTRLVTLPLLIVAIHAMARPGASADGVPSASPMTLGGTLLEGGAPVNGRRAIALRLWDSAAGGAQVCSEASGDVEVVHGHWGLALPTACNAAVRARPQIWLETVVGGVSLGREMVGAVPYALEASRASEASGGLATRLAGLEARAAGQRQIEIGAASTFVATSAGGDNPWIEAPGGPTLDIVPRATGRYRLTAPLLAPDSDQRSRPARARLRCAPSAAVSWEAQAWSPHNATALPQTTEAIVNLVAGTTYRCFVEVSGSRAIGSREEGSAILAESLD